MEKIADVDIDEAGRFKYILIKITAKSSPKGSKLIVRGYGNCEYHADIFDEVSPAIESAGFKTNCLGGGRIQHEPQKRTLKVFGYSQGFGKADHSETVEILKTKYPDYEITWSDEGY